MFFLMLIACPTTVGSPGACELTDGCLWYRGDDCVRREDYVDFSAFTECPELGYTVACEVPSSEGGTYEYYVEEGVDCPTSF